MLLEPQTWSAVNRIEAARAALPATLAACTSAETHACVIELKTAPHDTVAALVAELAQRRGELGRALRDRLGLRAAAAGTHPLAMPSDVAVAPEVRYREIAASLRALARREPTMALHVHVAVPDEETAVRALDGLRGDLAVLLALSANSPFWRGADSGFASIRTPIFAMFPRAGIPRRFGSYEAYVRLVDALLHSSAVHDPGYMWWDARLQPRLGTVEVRVIDAQTRVADVAALAALVQCLVRSRAQSGPPRTAEAEILAENRFLAARDGMSAWFIAGSGRRPAGDVLAEMLDCCQGTARALGCTAELASARALADDPGYARQRLMAACDGVEAVPAGLAAAFAGADVAATAA